MKALMNKEERKEFIEFIDLVIDLIKDLNYKDAIELIKDGIDEFAGSDDEMINIAYAVVNETIVYINPDLVVDAIASLEFAKDRLNS
jgi:hypothetical protein